MATLKDLKKRHLIALDRGLDLGRVDDILLHPSEHRVACLVVRAAEVPEISIVCPASAVRSYAADQIAIPSVTSLSLGHENADLLELLRANDHMRKRPVLSSEGKSLGRIRAIDVDNAGHVVMYYVGHGPFGLFGRREIPPEEVRALGGDVAVLKADGIEKPET